MTMPAPSSGKPPVTPPHNLGAAIHAVHALHGKWPWIVGLGAALTVLGMLALAFNGIATIATVLINGWIMVVAGLAEIYIGSRAKDWKPFFFWVLAGALYLAAGMMALVNPVLGSVVLTLLLGIGLLAAGVARLYLATRLPANPARPLVMLSAFVTMFLGVIVITGWPANSLFVLGMLLGVELVFQGVGWVGFGLRLKGRH